MMGAFDLDTLTDQVTSSAEAALDYIRSKWVDFTHMSGRIIDLQHRAAQLAYAAQQAGDTTSHDLAQGVIKALGELNVQYGRALDMAQGVMEYIGLSSYRGLGSITVLYATILTSLAALMVWVYASYATQARKLDMIQAGTLSPQEAAAIDAGIGSAPGQVLGGIASVGKVALALGLAYLAYRVYTDFVPKPRVRRNPDLTIFDVNPPELEAPELDELEDFGEEVYAVFYRHAEDGQDYVHAFGHGVDVDFHDDGSVTVSHDDRTHSNVEMLAEDDGAVVLQHRDGKPVWREF